VPKGRKRGRERARGNAKVLKRHCVRSIGDGAFFVVRFSAVRCKAMG